MKPCAHHWLITCEHARNAIPSRYPGVRDRAGAALESHRGYDPGALELSRYLAKHCQAPLLTGRCSRLLVELNRSVGHPHLWSEFSRHLSPAEKEDVLRRYYHPYRREVEAHIRRHVQAGRRVWHVSVHSFTPVLHGEVRRAEIGLLYDPGRRSELLWAARWQKALRGQHASWRVRRNYPYLGVADGLVTHLRKQFGGDGYAGLELEVNQGLMQGKGRLEKAIRRVLMTSLKDSLSHQTRQKTRSR